MNETAPASSEIEVSIFGRGYGESVLLHVGDGAWIVIDSLLDRAGKPAAIGYLQSIGVDPANAIELILATHWHDDHVRGLAEIYRVATRAKLALPGALQADEWRAFHRAARERGTERFKSGVAELDRLSELRAATGRPPFLLTRLNHILLRKHPTDMSHGQSVTVEALAPADADLTAFYQALSRYEFDDSASRVETAAFDRNDVSVAAWVRVGSHRLLLGADLEVFSNRDRGWDAVLQSPAPLDGRAGVFKIAHHGSQNGHHAGIWASHVDSDPVAVLAPWNRGTKLPKPEDVKRITSLTTKAYAASQMSRKSPTRPAVVEKTLREQGLETRARPSDVGQVRLRLDLAKAGASWSVELIDGAVSLKSLAA